MDYLDIPENIKALLINSIESVGQLEVLLFFLNFPMREFNAEDVSRELRSHPASALKQMIQLNESGLLRKSKEPDFFIYSPKNSALHQTVEQLLSIFKERPVKIISFIYDKPKDKLQGFADAFRLIKKD